MKHPAPDPRVQTIIWLALGGSQMIFLAVGALIAPPPNPDQVQLAQVLALPAMLTAGASIALGVIPSILPALRGPTRNIFRWAIAESAGLFGLVALMVCGDPLYQYAYATFGLVAWALAIPRDVPPTRAG
jgi:hypothetical protein